MSFKRSIIPLHIQYIYIDTWRIFPCPSPLAGFPLLPFIFLSTYLAPSSCDRNRPPPSQVACTQLTHPPQIPRTPPAPRLAMTTSGIFRLLLSGTPRCMRLISWTLRSGSEQERFSLLKKYGFLDLHISFLTNFLPFLNAYYSVTFHHPFNICSSY
jgi:hypothetical protein